MERILLNRHSNETRSEVHKTNDNVLSGGEKISLSRHSNGTGSKVHETNEITTL